MAKKSTIPPVVNVTANITDTPSAESTKKRSEPKAVYRFGAKVIQVPVNRLVDAIRFLQKLEQRATLVLLYQDDAYIFHSQLHSLDDDDKQFLHAKVINTSKLPPELESAITG